MKMRNAHSTALLAAALGLLGGAGLIALQALAHKGSWIFVAYCVLTVAIFEALRFRRVAMFRSRFAFSLAVLMLATLIVYVGTALFLANGNMPTAGHVVRLAVVFAVSAVVSLLIARYTPARP